MFQKAGQDKDGAITFDQVCRSYKTWDQWSEKRLHKERLLFDQIDSNGDGVLQYQELFEWTIRQMKEEEV